MATNTKKKINDNVKEEVTTLTTIIQKAKPTSPGRRHVVNIKTKGLAGKKARKYKNLLAKKKKTGGRNNNGRITTRHIGGGHKQHLRLIDFKRNKDDIPAKVERFEYDPNRTAHIALLLYVDGERRYVLAAKGMGIGDQIISGSGDDVPIKTGNALPLHKIPLGTKVHNIELKPGKGGQMMRSAGASAQILGMDDGGKYIILKLRSGETRKVLAVCRATIGEVGNEKHNLKKLGKAGASRWRGVRPTVRGVAMNPVDHPHGGGEGRTSGGRHPVSPWGVPTKGKKTRKNKRTDKQIVKRASASKRRK